MKKYLLVLLSTLLILASGSVVLADTQQSEFREKDIENQRIIDNKPLCSLDDEGNIVEPSFRIDANSVRAKGSYPNTSKSKGTILYTKDTDLKIAGIVGHAAIVHSSGYVIEASASGVDWGKNTWYRKKHCRAGVIRSLSASKRSAAAGKCRSWLKKPYNWNFWNTSTRAKFYCSQLVYAGYIDTSKYNLNADGGIVFPSELISNSGVSIVYRKG